MTWRRTLELSALDAGFKATLWSRIWPGGGYWTEIRAARAWLRNKIVWQTDAGPEITIAMDRDGAGSSAAQRTLKKRHLCWK
jgi:hypothetical protein